MNVERLLTLGDIVAGIVVIENGFDENEHHIAGRRGLIEHVTVGLDGLHLTGADFVVGQPGVFFAASERAGKAGQHAHEDPVSMIKFAHVSYLYGENGVYPQMY